MIELVSNGNEINLRVIEGMEKGMEEIEGIFCWIFPDFSLENAEVWDFMLNKSIHVVFMGTNVSTLKQISF